MSVDELPPSQSAKIVVVQQCDAATKKVEEALLTLVEALEGGNILSIRFFCMEQLIHCPQVSFLLGWNLQQ